MRHSHLLFSLMALIVAMTACTSQQPTQIKDMKQLSFDNQQAQCMSAIACLEAQGDQSRLRAAINDGLDAGLTVSQIKEALSQLYAYTGFPRSLNALGTLKQVLEERTDPYEVGTEAAPMADDYDALKEGTEVQTMLTGQPFDYQFAPQTDYYLKAHLFGDIFARDNLTYADRELITVSALSGMEGVEPQLLAHVNGARNMGLTDTQLTDIVLALLRRVGKAEAARASKAIAQVLGTDDEVGLRTLNAVDLKSAWKRGEPNTAYARYFIGRSYLYPMQGGVSNVTFEPGCRNNWHIHHGAVQVLICVYGRGWYQEWGKKAVPLTEGTVIAIPEGVKHWHGAAKGSWMQHLTYHTDLQAEHSNEWLEPVTDEQYALLP